MKILLFAIVLVVVGCAHDERGIEEKQKQSIADATNGAITNGFDPSFVEALPSQRVVALKNAQPTGDDSTEDIYNKSQAYFSTLTNIIQGICSHYYFHKDFPTDLFAGLEQHAIVLAGVQYPLSASTGSSGYSALLIQNRIKLAEDLICQMVQAIYESAYWNTGAQPGASKRGEMLYHVWLKKWNESLPEKTD
jgi:hypothetical protein